MSEVQAVLNAETGQLEEPNGNHTPVNQDAAESSKVASRQHEPDKFEKLDELTSLEREIAELHHVEPPSPSLAEKVKDVRAALVHDDYDEHESLLMEMQPPPYRTTPSDLQQNQQNTGVIAAGIYTTEGAASDRLEDEDLIAVLKGVGETEPKIEMEPDDNYGSAAVGVTIEGEGEFQIMEIVDDDTEDVEDSKADESSLSAARVEQKKTYTNRVLLTKEEERSLAMEQMEVLNARKEQHMKNRRKQDIKPMPIPPVETNDLVSLLGADWSDDDAGADPLAPADIKAPVVPVAITSNTATKANPTISQASSVSIVVNQEKKVEKIKRRNSQPKITSVVMLKNSAAQEQRIPEIKKEESTEKIKEPESKPTVELPQQTTGFKRTRIIKRKIIWDPDAPETTFSYAQLVRPSNASPSTSKINKNDTAKTTTASANVASTKTMPAAKTALAPTKTASAATKTASAVTTGSLPKKDPIQKKIRPTTPKDKKLTLAVAAESKAQRASTPKLPTKATASSSVTASKETTGKLQTKTEPTMSPVKRRAQTPVANGANKKKKVSEIDRLMGDEGAVNMLNSLESERQKLAGECSDLPKPNMRSRSATISEKFIKRDTTPVKKDSPTLTKSKRVVKPKASASWDYVYKQQATEDSMIIRRRSNSSYSSSASVHRSSLDSTPANSTKNAHKSISRTTPTVKTEIKSKISSATVTPGESLLKSSNSSSTAGKAFEFAKPESKFNQKLSKPKSPQAINPLASDMKKGSANSRRAVRSPATVDERERSPTKLPTIAAKDDGAAMAGVVVKRFGKVAQIIFSTGKSKIEHSFNLELLGNLVETLNRLDSDANCHAVVITTNAANFCHGLDFTELTVGTLEKRKKAAAQLGAAAKNFIKALATFPKPLIAGVNGSNIGLGVTMLPLFDIVIASDKGSYETPYAKIGQVPEGFCIWNANSKIRGTFKTKLFWLCEKLHSTESALSGLVNKLNAPNKVNEDALGVAKRIAALSAESYRSMKQTTIDANSDIISTDLEQEFKTIIEQWSSDECYENFKKYTQTGHW